MKKYFIDLFRFYKNPKDERIDNYTLKKNIKYIIITFLLDLSLFIILFPFLYYLSKNNLIPEDVERIDYADNTFYKSLIIVAFLVPAIEEIIFRLPMRYNKLYAYVIPVKVWNVLFKILVFTLPLLFGFVHLYNYGQITFSLIIIAPVLIGSQIIGGYLYTFLRVKFNFASALVSHSLWNLILSLTLVFYLSFEKPYKQDNQDFTIEIKQFEYNDLEKQKIDVDSIGSHIFNIESNQYSLNHLVDTIAHGKREKQDIIVNLKFTSKKGVTKERFIEIIEEYDKNND